MKYLRWISKAELQSLKNNKIINVGKKTYFFPFDEEYEDIESILYDKHQFLTGVVGKYDNKWLILYVDLKDKKLEEYSMTYADPNGHFFDTIWVEEVTTEDGYSIPDIEKAFMTDWYGKKFEQVKIQELIKELQ